MVNVGYHSARVRGSITRSLYQSALPHIVRRPLSQDQTIPAQVYALSCERDLPEQVASIRSFIRHVGVPQKFVVISDGSYTEASCQLLRQIHGCVEVIPLATWMRSDLPTPVYDYAAQHPMGKKLATLLSLPIDSPTIYTDSDILFFPGALALQHWATSESRDPWYLPDCATSMDQRVIAHPSEALNPVNGGFLLFKERPNWDFALQRLSQLSDLNHYFTEQTLVHLTMHHNQAKPLCPNHYVLTVDDQFVHSDQYANNQIILRHYVSDIRHKFWFNIGI